MSKLTQPLADLLMQGVRAQQSGDHESAHKYYLDALAMAPGHSIALHMCGMAAKEMGQFETAERYLREAVLADPKDAEIRYNLAVLLQELGRSWEAMEMYREVLKITPLPAAHFNLAVLLMALEGDADGAIMHYRAALPAEPNNPDLHHNLGNALAAKGEMDAARKAYRTCIEYAPAHGPAHRCLGLITKYTPDHPHLTEMEKLLATQPDDYTKMHVHFALGKAWDELKNVEKAFSHFEAANALMQKFLPYDAVRTEAEFEVIQNEYAATPLACHGTSNMVPIFIVGMPRSGTTLVEQILASHPEVTALGESFALESSLVETGGKTGDLLAECYLKKLNLPAGAQVFTDKMPFNFRFLGWIAQSFPHAVILHCTREPMDTGWSIYKTCFEASHAFAYGQESIAHYWQHYRGLMDFWEQWKPGFVHEVSYEALIAEPEAQVKQLLEICGLPWDSACMKFHEHQRAVHTASNAQVRKPIYNSSVGAWKSYEKYLGVMRKVLR